MNARIWKLTLVIILFSIPLLGMATGTKFYYGGWLPFWKKQSGATDISLNLEKLNEVSPFSYEVNPDGTLKDVLKINEGLWPGWLKAARDSGAKVIPTIALFDGDQIHKLLSNAKRRVAHEDTILKLVVQQKFHGIDIDYEGKLAETNKYFSTFLKGLSIRLKPKGKILSCTIESRTPVDSRYSKTGTAADTEYANDYAAMNIYCDEVRIMAYDQGAIDLKLDEAKGNGNFYVPVADPDWVEKVLKETIKTIARKKIMLGIPTYGYEYQVNWMNNFTTYRRLRSVNYFTAMDLAERVNALPKRNRAGELSFNYVTSTFREVSATLRRNVSSTLPAGFMAADLNSTSTIIRFVSFTDAEAVRQKIQLAKKYKLRGVVFFKLDGEADPMIWEEMK